jgi:hypothetical protein
MEQLIAQSDAIVRATVRRTGEQLETFDGRLEPHTIAQLTVDDWMKGDGGPELTIDEIGGVVDGNGRWIDGTPRYRAGREVIVFLRRLPSGAYRTVGMEQGYFEVVHRAPSDGGFVERDTSSIAFASWVDGEMQVHEGGRSPSVPLDTFVGFVVSVLDQLALPPTTSTTGGGR